MLLDKKIERIYYRPQGRGEDVFWNERKSDSYLRPLYDALYDLLDFGKIQKRIEIGDIEIAPLAFMRGRTLKNSFAILDEAQNARYTNQNVFNKDSETKIGINRSFKRFT